MKRFIAALGFCALSFASYAGTVSISVTNVANGTVTKTFTVPDADLVRRVAAYQSQANVSINGTATRLQVLNYIATAMMQGWVDATKAFEASAATATATASITPITAN